MLIVDATGAGCKGNKIYIKPQLVSFNNFYFNVVKVIKSISNHNCVVVVVIFCML